MTSPWRAGEARVDPKLCCNGELVHSHSRARLSRQDTWDVGAGDRALGLGQMSRGGPSAPHFPQCCALHHSFYTFCTFIRGCDHFCVEAMRCGCRRSCSWWPRTA